ncbi:MAG: PH domain-containing protein [Planctomycetota bacterium]
MDHENPAPPIAPLEELEPRIIAITRPKRELLTLYIIYAAMSVVAFPFVFPVLYFRYHTLKFRFDREGIGVSYGILFRREHYLTYARIQDIHLTRDLFERWLGIGTVQLQTASGGSGGDLSIPGTDQFDMIRDYLYLKMRGAHVHGSKGAAAANATNPAAPARDAETATALREVAAALRETAAMLKENRKI